MLIDDRRAWPVRALDRLDERTPSDLGRPLAPLGLLYGLGGSVRRRLRGVRALPRPPLTLGVGNLRVGGTGKTPVVGDLARRWQQRGRSVAVAMRGYRAEGGGDEPGWFAAHDFRVFAGSDRQRSTAEAAAAGVEILLLDDALQANVRPTLLLAIVLDRDLSRMPRTLPAGPAREPAGALRRADALLVRVESDPWPVPVARRDEYRRAAAAWTQGAALAFRLAPRDLVDEDDRSLALGSPEASQPCVLVSGLARPQSFENDCRRAGLRALASVRLADHANPSRRDVAAIEALASRLGAVNLVCPEKNRVRLRRWRWSLPLFAMRSDVEWDTEDPLSELDRLVSSP